MTTKLFVRVQKRTAGHKRPSKNQTQFFFTPRAARFWAIQKCKNKIQLRGGRPLVIGLGDSIHSMADGEAYNDNLSKPRVLRLKAKQLLKLGLTA